jgi:hypothetical protein
MLSLLLTTAPADGAHIPDRLVTSSGVAPPRLVIT